MKIEVIKHPEEEPVSLEEIKHYLRIDTKWDDELLIKLIKTARNVLEEILCRSLIKQQLRYFVDIPLTSLPKLQDFGKMSFKVPIPRSPVNKIIEVKIGKNKIKEENYALIELYGKSYVVVSLDQLPEKRLGITVDYEAGYSENAKNVPEPLRLSLLMLVADSYNKRDGFSATSGLPVGIRHLIQPYRILNVA